MRTLRRASHILSDAPLEAARDAFGLSLIVLAIFAGFLVPAML